MSHVVSFVCYGCKATLGIPAEMAGISGPCPFCGTQVTSPALKPNVVVRPVLAPVRSIAPPVEEKQPEPVAVENPPPRTWLQPQLVVREEPAVSRGRPRRPGFLIVAGVAIFAAGVAGTWKLWQPDRPAKAPPQPEGIFPVSAPLPRPEALASSDDPPPGLTNLPAPDETIPDVLPPATTAVARNISDTPAPPVAVPVVSSPGSAEAGVKSPDSAKSAPPAKMSAAEKEIRKVVPTDGHLERPGTALIRFLAAPTWQERLKYTLAPAKVKPLMEQHYKTHADGPVIPEDIQLTRIEATEEDRNRKYYAFVLFLPDIENGLPVSVEDTKDGCLVEWCSFVEAKDQTLAKFFSGYRKEPGTFRVLVRRSHYFGDDVPDQESKECLEAVAPDTTGPFHLWLDRTSVAYTKYFAKGERTRWDISSMMVLTCQWEKTSKGVQFVRLREVVADSWHPAMLPAPAAAKK